MRGLLVAWAEQEMHLGRVQNWRQFLRSTFVTNLHRTNFLREKSPKISKRTRRRTLRQAKRRLLATEKEHHSACTNCWLLSLVHLESFSPVDTVHSYRRERKKKEQQTAFERYAQVRQEVLLCTASGQPSCLCQQSHTHTNTPPLQFTPHTLIQRTVSCSQYIYQRERHRLVVFQTPALLSLVHRSVIPVDTL